VDTAALAQAAQALGKQGPAIAAYIGQARAQAVAQGMPKAAGL
jgi:hypothetical protein